jgi:hypothetical protein
MVFTVRGTTLPDRVEQTFAADGEWLRTDPAADAEPISEGGWLLKAGLEDT